MLVLNIILVEECCLFILVSYSCVRILLLLILSFVSCFMAAYVAHLINVLYDGQQH